MTEPTLPGPVEREPIVAIGETGDPLKIPLWVDAQSTGLDPAIYEGMFLFIEPMAEYVYYLAGDFERTDKGILAYRSASVELKVEVTFERDCIEVHYIDDWADQERARQQQRDIEDYSEMSLGEVLHSLAQTPDWHGVIDILPLSEQYRLPSREGMARVKFFKPPGDDTPVEVIFIFQSLAETEGFPERLLLVQLVCNNMKQNIGELISEFEQLIARFGRLPYEKLEGATRR